MKIKLFLGTLLLSIAVYSQSFTKQIVSGIGTIDNRALIVEDLDNNSMPDLFFPNRISGNNYFFKNFSGSFLKQPSTNIIVSNSASTAAVMAGDSDGDCDLDLYFANGAGSRNINQLFELSNTSYSQNSSSGTTIRNRTSSGGNWVDLDKDGDLDLFVVNFSNQKNEYYKNIGNNNFIEVDTLGFTANTANSSHGTFRDFDGDGDLDLFIANAGSTNNTYFRNDDTTFFSLKTGSIVSDGGNSFTASAGDYDNDGDQDIFVGNTGFQKNFLYRNDTNGFTKITTGSITSGSRKSKSSAWFDMDNDGDLDLIVGNNGSNKLFKNNGNGNFSSVSAGNLTSDIDNHTALAIADVDRNGTEDIVTVLRNKSPVIFYNNDTSNNYININLLGTGGKGLANNAQVSVKANISGNGVKWIKRIASNNKGRNAQSTHKVHFGLGSATNVDSLVVKWVDGTRCTFTNVAVNGFFNVKPSGCKMDTILYSKISDSTSYRTAQFNSDSSKGAITSYHWDFGDGDTSNLKNPKHRYQSPGTYSVCLTTFDSYCKWDSVCTTIDICPDTSQIGFDYQSVNLLTSFTDTSVSNGYKFAWDFGDGDTAQGKNVTHPYASSGNYQVCLTVTDSCRSKTICDSIFVCDTLTPGFGYASNGFQISFSDSSNADGVQYLFGDGNSDTARNPSHVYAQAGIYNVCQIASNLCGSDTLCQTIRVCLDTAQSAFTTTINANLVNFNSSASQNANQFFWDFGDGNTSVQPNPSHIYNTNGTFTACLVVTNDCFSDTSCQTINVCPYNPGQADFSASKLAIPNAVKFTDLSVNATSHLWDFGDGASSSNKNPTHVFPREDDYNVCLTIVDSCGNSDSTCQIINPATIGLDELALQDWKIYPNPVSHLLHVETADNYETLTIEVVNITGQTVLVRTYDKVQQQTPLTLSLAHLPKGAYILRFSANAKALPLNKMILKQ